MRTTARSVRRLANRVYDDTLDRIRRRGRSALLRALRLTGAAVASYLVALWFSPSSDPLLAPLTALLVVQLTLFNTLEHGLQRVVSVVAGVLLAVLFSSVVGLTWWSLGALVAASIIVGQLLRLGPHLLEVPISAMLVLGVGGAAAGVAALGRVGETLVGAVVGLLVNVLFPPHVRTRDAGAAIEAFAEEIAGLLDRAATELVNGPTPEQAGRWLDDARRFSRHIPRLDSALEQAEESRRLNLRAFGTTETSSTLRDGLDALEHSAVAVRSMFRSILDGMRSESDAGEYAVEIRQAFAVLLNDIAEAVRSYGRLVRAEADDAGQQEEAEVGAALEHLREARARVSDLLLAGPRDDPQFWELNITVLATVERVLRELDLTEHVRLRERSRQEAEERRGAAVMAAALPAAERLRMTTRQLAERSTRRRPEPPQ